MSRWSPRADEIEHRPDDTEADAEFIAEQAFRRLVAEETRRLRVRDTATRLIRAEHAAQVPDPVPLRDFLAIADTEARYRIGDVWPTGGRVVLAAQYKAGKSTLVGNVLRCLADGTRFLGRYDVTRPDGKVVLIDNELDERTLRRWLRAQGVADLDRVVVVALRGRTSSFDLLDDDTRARWAKQLRAVDAAVVVLDCLRPVLDALGLDEARDAGRFLVGFDALIGAAGVGEALVVHHMGHAAERSRGDSRIRDWPDAEWRLVREVGEDGEPAPDGRRYFTAYGRDVDQPEGLLTYDAGSRRLTLAGGNRRETAADALVPVLLAWLGANPGASGRKIETALTPPHPRQSVRLALRRAVTKGLVLVDRGGNRGAFEHRVAPPSTGQQGDLLDDPETPQCASAPEYATSAPAQSV